MAKSTGASAAHGSRSRPPKLAVLNDAELQEFRIELEQYQLLDRALNAVESAQQQANLVFATIAAGLMLEGGDLVTRRVLKGEGVLVMRNVVRRKRKGR